MKRAIEDLYFYFGRDVAHSYIAFPIGNVAVTGCESPGFMNNLLIKLLQESNPKNINITLMDANGNHFGWWKDCIPPYKTLPHMKKMVSLGQEVDSLEEFSNMVLSELKEFISLIRTRNVVKVEKCFTSREFLVINSLDKCYAVMNEEQKSELSYLIKEITQSSGNANAFLIIATDESFELLTNEMVERFDTRIAIPETTDDKTMCAYLGLNTTFESTHGVAWIKSGRQAPVKLYIPFYPNTWIGKFLRVMSIRNASFQE